MSGDRPDGTMPDTPITAEDPNGVMRRLRVDIVRQLLTVARPVPVPTWDRKGWPLWWDDFQDGIDKWESDLLGDASAAVASSEAALRGFLSAKLTAGDLDDDYGRLWRYFANNFSGFLGLETSIAWPDTNADAILRGTLEISPSTYHYGVRFAEGAPPQESVYILGGDGVWAEISAVTPYADEHCCHMVKLVVNLTTRKYVRVIVDGVLYDLSAYSMMAETAYVGPRIGACLEAKVRGDNTGSAYFGHFILTEEEA